MDKGPEDCIPSGNEPQSRQPMNGCKILPATIIYIERETCYLNACNYSIPDEGFSGAETLYEKIIAIQNSR